MRRFFYIATYLLVLVSFFCCKPQQKSNRIDSGPLTENDSLEVDEIGLAYDSSTVNARAAHFLMNEMMTTLWSKDSTETNVDFYKRWAERITTVIDSLTLTEKVFDEDKSVRYEQAMNDIRMLIEPGDRGCQQQLNITSYVRATTEMFLMQHKQLELVEAFPNVDIWEECRRYSSYMKQEENGETAIMAANEQAYSDRTREDNEVARIRFEQRKNDMNNLIIGKKIAAVGKRPSADSIRVFYHKLMPWMLVPARGEGEPEPSFFTDTIGIRMLEWVACRDRIARKLPKNIGESYYNQTTNYIIKRLQRAGQRLEEGQLRAIQ